MVATTEVELVDAERIARAHGLPAPSSVARVTGGSVNANYWLRCDTGRWFLRVYEEQDATGVTYEWSLLSRLAAGGVPVPRRVDGPPAGRVTVDGKPVGVFETMPGGAICQAGVTAALAATLGRALATAHTATDPFSDRRAGRFTPAALAERVDRVRSVLGREELDAAEAALAAMAQAAPRLAQAADIGVIHGDLFRDNVLWVGGAIAGLLDWESASDGARVYDLMVTVLAWCVGRELDWELARALVGGYLESRPLLHADLALVRDAGLVAAARFTITRITDFELQRPRRSGGVYKDYRRFLARLRALQATSARDCRARLVGLR